MPRIRTIKPEFWDSPSTAKASKTVRLLYLAMWNWADDHGRGTANASQLLSFAFPNDAELPTLIAEAPCVYAEVADAYEVVFYEVSGRRYYAVLNWEDHQKNERKANSKHPPPPESVLAGQRPEWVAGAEMRGTSVQSRGSSGIGTGEQGNRGTGESSSSYVSERGREDTHDDEDRPGGVEVQPLLPPTTTHPMIQIPDDWAPNELHRAKHRRRDLDELADAFIEHAISRGRLCNGRAGWDAAFSTWVRKSKPAAAGGSTTDARILAAQALKDPERRELA